MRTFSSMSEHHTRPFNDTVTAMMAKNMRVIEIWKRFSGPLGLYFLFFFTSKLFSMLIPSFHVIFGKKGESFFRKKGKEFFFTMLFALLQAVIFFVTVIMFVMATKVVGTISARQHPMEGIFYPISSRSLTGRASLPCSTCCTTC